jgi:hypothetical protein
MLIRLFSDPDACHGGINPRLSPGLWKSQQDIIHSSQTLASSFALHKVSLKIAQMDFLQVISLLSFLFTAVVAFPQQTAAGTTTATPAMITKAASLSCSDGQTAVYTTDCTMGTPTSYCARPEPPIQCSEGYFPSVWHPGHCMEMSTCFPLDAPWITTECSHGAIPWTTKTLYEGTLAGGQSTIISGESFLFVFSDLICPSVPALPNKVQDLLRQ